MPIVQMSYENALLNLGNRLVNLEYNFPLEKSRLDEVKANYVTLSNSISHLESIEEEDKNLINEEIAVLNKQIDDLVKEVFLPTENSFEAIFTSDDKIDFNPSAQIGTGGKWTEKLIYTLSDIEKLKTNIQLRIDIFSQNDVLIDKINHKILFTHDLATITPSKVREGFLAKFDSEGKIVWNIGIGMTPSALPKNEVVDPNDLTIKSYEIPTPIYSPKFPSIVFNLKNGEIRAHFEYDGLLDFTNFGVSAVIVKGLIKIW